MIHRFRFSVLLPFLTALMLTSATVAAPCLSKTPAGPAQNEHVPKYLAGVPLIPRSTTLLRIPRSPSLRV